MRGILVILVPNNPIGCGSWIIGILLLAFLTATGLLVEGFNSFVRTTFYPNAQFVVLAEGNNPRWVSGNRIEFLRRRDGTQTDVYYEINIDGSDLETVDQEANSDRYTTSYLGCGGKDQSVKGTYAFCQDMVQRPDEVYVSDTRGTRFLTYLSCQKLVWSPNGNDLLCFGFLTTYWKDPTPRDGFESEGLIILVPNAGNR